MAAAGSLAKTFQAAVKLGEWSLHFYRLPYVRDIQWVYAAENSGDYVLLKIVADQDAWLAEQEAAAQTALAATE